MAVAYLMPQRSPRISERECTCPQAFAAHDALSHLRCIITRKTGLKPIACDKEHSGYRRGRRWPSTQPGTDKDSVARLLRYISPFDFSRDREDLLVDYEDLRPSFFKTRQFRQWSEGRDWVLHGHGDPRSGKTTFAAAIAQHLLDAAIPGNLPGLHAAVVSIFVDRNHQSSTIAETPKQSQIEAILGAILRQLIEQCTVSERLELAAKAAWAVSVQSAHGRVANIAKCISEYALFFSRVHLVMDDLDQLDDSIYHELQDALRAFGRTFGVLLTSSTLDRTFLASPTCDDPVCELPNDRLLVWRHCEECSYFLCASCYDRGSRCHSSTHSLPAPQRIVHHRISVNQSDLTKYIDARLDKLMSYNGQLPDDLVYAAQRITKQVYQCSSGNFGQAKLILDRMINDSQFDDIVEIADRLPGFQVRHLNFLLSRVVQQQSIYDRKLAHKALALAAVADRSETRLSLDELVDALKFLDDLNPSDTGSNNITRCRVLRVTQGLLQLEGEVESVIPYHVSVVNYLRDECPHLAMAPHVLAELCAQTLRDCAQTAGQASDPDGRTKLENSLARPFVGYAHRNATCLAQGFNSPLAMVDFLDKLFEDRVSNLLTQVATNRDCWVGSDMLHVCAHYGFEEAMNVYLDRGHDPDIKDVVTGATPAIAACSTRNIAVVEALLHADADFSSTCNAGHSALWKAIENQQYAIVKLLLERTDARSLNVRCGSLHETAIMRASQDDIFDYDTFSMLASNAEIEVSVRDRTGRSLLHRITGAPEVNFEALQCLINGPHFQAIVNDSEDNAAGRNALMFVLQSHEPSECKLQIIQLLVENGASLAHLDKRKQGILHYAARNDDCVPLIEFILSKKQVNVNSLDTYGRTALDVAQLSNADVTGIEILQSATKDATDTSQLPREDSGIAGIGISPAAKTLPALVEHLNRDPTRFLSDFGSDLAAFADTDIQAIDHNADTLLHLAVQRTVDETLVKVLLDDGRIDINAANATGRTALHLALVRLNETYDMAQMQGDLADPELEMVFSMTMRLLQDLRTDLSYADDNGKHPIDAAWELASILGDGERNNGVDKPSISVKVLFELIERGASLEHFSRARVQQAFECAIKEASWKSNPHPKVIDTLIAHGADVFRKIETLKYKLPWQVIRPNRSNAHAEIMESLLREQRRVFSHVRNICRPSNVVCR